LVGDIDGGIRFVDRALVLNPNLAIAWSYFPQVACGISA
jgi:hypothetical protein